MENKLEYDYDVILCKKCGMKYPKEIEENHKNFCNKFCKNCQSCPYCLKDIPIKLYDSHILNHYNISEIKNNNDLLNNNNNNNNNFYFNDENYNNFENNNINNNNNNIINNNIINNNNNHIINNNNNNIIINNNNFQNNIINNNQNNFNSINISNNNNNNNNNNNILSQQFFDVSDEAKLENEKIEKELYEKKILGIVKDVKKKKKKKLGEKLKELDIDIEDGILATIDIIGCVFLVGPSITRTGIRLINLVNKLTNKNDENIIEETNENGLTQNENNNIEKIIETLPTSILKKKIENSSIQCIICMEDFLVGDKVSTLPCFHVFHTNCIDKWLLKTHSCPICKFKVTMNSLIMNYEKLYKDK